MIINIAQSLRNRRTYYAIDKNLPVPFDVVAETVRELTALVPDAFDMKSSRVVVVSGAKQDELWDAVYDTFGGKVPREKIDGFKAGAGTVLYFLDQHVIANMQAQFPRYVDNFPVWASQASGMLQISVWSALRELGVGANLQHYNPVIDERVKELLGLPEEYALVAQMPFGGIVEEPQPKQPENIDERVTVIA